MEKCKNIKCEKEHDGSYGSGRYCSRQCANSRNWTEEDKLKKSIAGKNSEKVKEFSQRQRSQETIDKMAASKKVLSRKSEERLLQEDFNTLSFERLRKRVLIEQGRKCNHCNLTEWQGLPIPLEIDHIDGYRENNSRNNIEAICPNCHALTSTWRGRNKRGRENKKTKVPDETLLKALLKHNWNMRQSLIEVGLAPKGGSYKRCHLLKRLTGNI